MSRPSFALQKVFIKILTGIHEIKEVFTLNETTYVGMCILNLSRILIYDFTENMVIMLKYCL